VTPHHLEIGKHVGLDAFEPWPRGFQAVRLNAECNVLFPDKSVVAFGELALEHVRIFLPDAVVFVAPLRDVDGFLEIRQVAAPVNEGKLHMDGRIEVV
jgi:hypothetical protein